MENPDEKVQEQISEPVEHAEVEQAQAEGDGTAETLAGQQAAGVEEEETRILAD